MKRLADSFAEQAQACAGLPALRLLVEDASRELGFRYFALLHHRTLTDPVPGDVRLDNYPLDWTREMLVREYAAHDPVHFASRRSSAAFPWSEIERNVRLDRRQHEVLLRGRHHGIGDGFTVPANVFGERAGSCSFAVEVGAELPARRLSCAALIGAEAFRAARRLRAMSPPHARTYLSRREAQCLGLIAAGKTDWEVAVILGLNVETVRQYVKRVRANYGVVSRTQLVALGLGDAWLDF